MVFSPDGRAARHRPRRRDDSSLAGPGPGAGRSVVGERGQRRLGRLGRPPPANAYPALWQLTDYPAEAVRFLRGKAALYVAAGADEIARPSPGWTAGGFADREAATKKLRQAGPGGRGAAAAGTQGRGEPGTGGPDRGAASRAGAGRPAAGRGPAVDPGRGRVGGDWDGRGAAGAGRVGRPRVAAAAGRRGRAGPGAVEGRPVSRNGAGANAGPRPPSLSLRAPAGGPRVGQAGRPRLRFRFSPRPITSLGHAPHRAAGRSPKRQRGRPRPYVGRDPKW